jgi:hypothetical protein
MPEILHKEVRVMNTANENTITTCCECGCVEEELFLVDGAYYCADCLQRLGYVRCNECGEWVHHTDAIAYGDGYVCEDCAANLDLVLCDECEEYDTDCVEVIGRYSHSTRHYCRHCLEQAIDRGRVYYCSDCETYYEERWHSSYTTHDGRCICEDCFSNSYGICYDCDEVFPVDDLRWSEEDDCYYCENCWSENGHDEDHSCIHDYGFKPSAVFHGLSHWGRPETGDPITMGFELEVDNGDDRYGCARELDEYFGEDTLYMKSDSSVDFEIVTHPHTLTAYMEELDFEKLCSIPRGYRYKSHDAGTCGFHIHVGRAQLGRYRDDQRDVIDRIAILMYRMWPALVKFSRRTEGQLSRWASAPTFHIDKRLKYNEARLHEIVREYYDCCGRYQALNLCPSGTIEFRLWRGSLQPATLKATIQLTYNIVMYAKDHTMYDMVHASWDDLVNYETCPELEAYLKERELESFTNTQDIPWTDEAEITIPERTPIYNVGDTVIITNDDGYNVASYMVGAVGIVRYARVRNVDYTGWLPDVEYALEITELPPAMDGIHCLHNCEGNVPGGNGYWVYEENIALWNVDSSTTASNF